jgi:predicted nucleic acid binding AN1-type Zn finger protein
MASSSQPTPAEATTSYTKMDNDLDALGRHCQLEYCHQLDFLPYKCGSCFKTFCLDHRTETAHKCAKEGDWARRRTGIDTDTTTTKKPSIYDHDKQCFSPSCKKLIDTARGDPGVDCPTCRHRYCLPHRFPENHKCPGPPPAPAIQAQRERGMAALSRLKSWGLSKKESIPAATVAIRSKLPTTDKKAAARASAAAMNSLKTTAKGDAKIPPEKRVYLYVEASADTTTAKYPTGKFFYNKEWTIGRVLDIAAKDLQVQNVNNRVPGEDEKLRVFHVEGGKLLEFSEKVGDNLKTGHMIVLLRGVGPPAPELITL